jgi:hypothetical protein
VRGHPKPQDLPPAMAHDQQTIGQPERDCQHDEEVHCDNASRKNLDFSSSPSWSNLSRLQPNEGNSGEISNLLR